MEDSKKACQQARAEKLDMIKAQSPEPHLTHRPRTESPPATRRPRRVALAWAALGLLGLLATVAPEQAVAQTEITLVGNAGQPTGERHTASFQGAVDHAQQFATGSDALWLHADESRVPVQRRPKPHVQRTVVRGQ